MTNAYVLTLQCHYHMPKVTVSLHDIVQCKASYYRLLLQALQGGCTVEEALMKCLLTEEEDGNDIAYASQQPDMLDNGQPPFDIPMGASQSNPVSASVRVSQSNGHVPVHAAANGSSAPLPPRQPALQQPVRTNGPAGGRQKHRGQDLHGTSCLPSQGDSLQHANSLGSQHSGLEGDSQVQ